MNPKKTRRLVLGSDGKAIVKKIRMFPKLVQRQKKQNGGQPNVFVFCESTTGVAQFRAESESNPNFTVEHVAGLLAMQCLVRGQDPNDFQVLVPAEKALAGRLVSRAEQLLAEGRAIACPASLSPRQKEVLHSVLSNRANKEIACKLNITVRTVKFHISTLLSKFGVESRTELARRAAGFLRPGVLDSNAGILDPSSTTNGNRELKTVSVRAPLQMTNKTNSVGFPERFLTA
jgi:DNA-binding CsgD family transcriptional regulator